MHGEMGELIRISEGLEPHVSLNRYPGISNDQIRVPYEEYTDETAKSSLDDAKKAMNISMKFIEEWFK